MSFVVVFFGSSVMMVTACWRGGECPNLQRRRCLFGHSAGEVAAALLVGFEAPRDDVLEVAEEVHELRRGGAEAARCHYVELGQPCRYSSRKNLLLKPGLQRLQRTVP